ncbi:MAG: protein-glutamate O-methyltransferase CheR [Burkholderiales bacterium]|nr:MAG: protein-glutamate O-methyltransferase CheR [Burkholderiales bacterium]
MSEGTSSISEGAFRQFQGLMHRVAGIHLAPTKRALICGRLAKRLRERGLANFDAYYRLISGHGEGEELQLAIDLLTTNETYFFREPQHFDYLARELLPQWRGTGTFRVWSAASSTGEEAYSLAMVLMDKLGPDIPWEVFGSDINRQVIAHARAATYLSARSEGIAPDYLRRYCLRGTGRMEGKLRIVPALRQRVRFGALNLNGDLSGAGEFDAIFLRNVMIYFETATKRRVVERLHRQLKPGGWLFIGHSETLNGISEAFQVLRPTIYRKET